MENDEGISDEAGRQARTADTPYRIPRYARNKADHKKDPITSVWNRRFDRKTTI